MLQDGISVTPENFRGESSIFPERENGYDEKHAECILGVFYKHYPARSIEGADRSHGYGQGIKE